MAYGFGGLIICFTAIMLLVQIWSAICYFFFPHLIAPATDESKHKGQDDIT